VQARSFADLLEQAMKKYQNRAIETAQLIEELIGLAKDMRSAHKRGETLGLTEDELAFYDALDSVGSRHRLWPTGFQLRGAPLAPALLSFPLLDPLRPAGSGRCLVFPP
jgi:type I site-specific restriction-modification system R (restriction) subunit